MIDSGRSRTTPPYYARRSPFSSFSMNVVSPRRFAWSVVPRPPPMALKSPKLPPGIEQYVMGQDLISSLRVAYLGPKGSFTHQAALQAFRNEELEPLVDFQAVFTAVQKGSVDRGVIPVENSTNGFVVQILDLLAQDFGVVVVGETHVAVQQSLLGRRRRRQSSPFEAPDLGYIRTLYSHPQAWGQCTPFLTKHLRNAERVDTTSTSKAAELVSHDKSGESAAICSPLAAELYGLDVLVPSIEERKGNTTRFLILQKSGTPIIPLEQDAKGKVPARYKTLICFSIPHTQPSSLANALAVFGKNGINLTSLNSRPSGERKWNYIFFVEFWGSIRDNGVEEALREVGSVVESWKWIGSWLSRGDGG